MQRWYVIQVATGKEEAMCRLISRVAAEPAEDVAGDLAMESGVPAAPSDAPAPAPAPSAPLLDECFTPRYETQRKVRGAWETVRPVLFPGYLIAVSANVEELERRLRRVPEFTRLLTLGERFVPLSQQDREWIGAFTTRGSRCVPMSMGVAEGQSVRVTQGPLKGHELLIKKIDRRRSTAYIELQMFGRTMQTKVGLGVLRPASSTDQKVAEVRQRLTAQVA